MEKYIYYKKGDKVPPKIEHFEDKKGNLLDADIIFGVDVKVSMDKSGYHIKPVKKMQKNECIICVHNNDMPKVASNLIGGLTTVYAIS
ncbi:MAG: hypothetical protein GX365_05200 [Clostridiales bacterium]|nr:hypothetical protein [Clostridiales bacterium]